MATFIDKVTQEFVEAHRHDDVASLALAPMPQGVDRERALRQLEGWHTALEKVPLWAATPDIVYPVHLSLEQCSSQATALLKASLSVGDTLVDLTGGMGVDFSFMAPRFNRAIYVERDEELCELARHNFACLGLTHCEVVHGNAEDYLDAMPEADMIFVDPARRDSHGGRVAALNQCSPDVEALHGALLAKSRRILLKLSPMLDWHEASSRLSPVREVLIVSVAGECKELLLLLDREHTGPTTVTCLNDAQKFAFRPDEPCPSLPLWDGESDHRYLFEPNASVMKAGCHEHVANRYGLVAVAHNSHLFWGDNPLPDFPGRTFIIDERMPLTSSLLKRGLSGLAQANVTVRNYPMRTDQLRRRLRLKDGGDTYLFATTAQNGRKWLFRCTKPIQHE